MGKRKRCPTPKSLCRRKKNKTVDYSVQNYKDASNLVVDRISELPLDILDNILSLLPLKEAAATSILSRRWRYAWTFTRNLNFDVDHTLFGFYFLERELQDERSRRYVDWVDRAVGQHRGSNIEQFRACFDINRHFRSSIDKWIQFAMEKSVQVLELDFLVGGLDSPISRKNTNFYTFPRRLLGLEEATTTPLSSDIPSLRGFAFLRVLDLTSVHVTNEVVDYFLYNCPVLERLSVEGADDLVGVRVVGPSVSLKYLSIGNCIDMESIEIRDADLVSFAYSGRRINLLLENVPLLVDVSICEWNGLRNHSSVDFPSLAFTQLSWCLPQLETLKLDLNSDTSKDYGKVFSCPTLANVKHLELIVKANDELAIHQLASFIKACPHMHRLVLKLEFLPAWIRVKKQKVGVESPHHNLKVVEIVGYHGREYVVEHVRYLIENGVALEQLVVDPGSRWCHRHPNAFKAIKHVKEEEEARDHALHQLKQMVPPTIQFVCL